MRSQSAREKPKEVKEMIKSYKDLEVYQESYRLAVEIYKLTNSIFRRETYEIVSQIKKASMSKFWGKE